MAPALKMKAPVSWSRAVAAPFPCVGLSRSASLGAALRHVTAEARQRWPSARGAISWVPTAVAPLVGWCRRAGWPPRPPHRT